MSEGIDDTIIVVKVSARSYANSRYISLLIFLSKEKIEVVDIICGISDNIYFANETVAFKDWVSIEKAMRFIKNLIVGVHLRVVESLKISVRNILKKEVIDSILAYKLNNDRKAVISFFENELKTILEDQTTLIDAYFQQTTLAKMLDQKALISSYLEKNTHLAHVPSYQDNKIIQTATKKVFSKMHHNEYLMIKSDFVFAPVSGTPISRLNIYDTIIVKIKPDKVTEDFITSIGGNKDKKTGSYMVTATIIEKFVNNNSETVVLVKLADGVYSKIIETERTKVVTLGTEYKTATTKKYKVETPKWVTNVALFFLLWLVCFIIIGIYIFA